MPLTFPNNPTVGQQETQNGRVYAWTGAAWELASVAVNVTGGSTDASDLTSGTLAFERLPDEVEAATDLYLWSSFR